MSFTSSVSGISPEPAHTLFSQGISTGETLAGAMTNLRGERQKGVVIIEKREEEKLITFSELYERALFRLALLREQGLMQGGELIIHTESVEEFLITFWAGILGGAATAPLAVRASEEHRNIVEAILEKLPEAIVAADSQTAETLLSVSPLAQRRKIVIVDSSAVSFKAALPLEPDPGDIAFIQYSSGSTGIPKGVILTHDNVMADIRAIAQGIRATPFDIPLSWMPMTHDMGLIGFHLAPLVFGLHHYLMPVSLFARKPLFWLEKASEYGATILGSPDFGLKLFLSAFRNREGLSWDLSRVRVIFNGAEPIDPEAGLRFVEALSPYGLKKTALFPVYGLAEASLAATFPPYGEDNYGKAVWVRPGMPGVGQRLELIPFQDGGNESAPALVPVGGPVAGCEVRVMDSGGDLAPEQTVGHIFIRGRNVSPGYYRDEERTAASYTKDGWLRTGDLGFISAGNLFIIGRTDDAFFLNGRHYYLLELERTAELLLETGPGKVAICSLPAHSNTDGAISLAAFVVFRKNPRLFDATAEKLRREFLRKTGLSLTEVFRVTRLPMTSSGKKMRHVLEKKYRTPSTLKHPAEDINGAGEKDEVTFRLLALVRDVLGDLTIRPGDNLSEFGVNSLKLLILHQEVDLLFPGVLTLADFFAHPGVAELAGLIRSRMLEKPFLSTVSSIAEEKRAGRPGGMKTTVKKLALLFPGQGSQHVGMGLEMRRHFPVAAHTFEEASDILHMDLETLCIEGPDHLLTRTDNAQPALFTLEMAKYRVFRQELGITPVIAAGHSLGEYTALASSGAISFRDGLRLVKRRGELMQEAGTQQSGGMSAISGLDVEMVEQICRESSRDGRTVVIANYNSPSQLVISGDRVGLAQAGEILTWKGARVVPLNVSAAFHSPLMACAAQSLAEFMKDISFDEPQFPVLSNVTGEPHPGAREIPVLLVQQLTHPVRWQTCMSRLKEWRIGYALELGPKKVLRNLMQKTFPEITVYSATTREDLLSLYELNPSDFTEKRPNLVERCLAMAASTRNRNRDISEAFYQTGVLEPYRRLENLFFQMTRARRLPDEEEEKEALNLLSMIFFHKMTPEDEQHRRIRRILNETR